MQYSEKVMLAMRLLENLGYSKWEVEFLLKNRDLDTLIETLQSCNKHD